MSNVLTIQRSKWRRGGDRGWSRDSQIGSGPTRLLNDEGFMCCLGFDALACGLTEDQIRNRHYPSSLVSVGAVAEDSDYAKTRTKERDHRRDDSEAAAAAANANDDRDLSEPNREQAVRTHLIALGWDDVVFVD
jgi:hypothetical protein